MKRRTNSTYNTTSKDVSHFSVQEAPEHYDPYPSDLTSQATARRRRLSRRIYFSTPSPIPKEQKFVALVYTVPSRTCFTGAAKSVRTARNRSSASTPEPRVGMEAVTCRERLVFGGPLPGSETSGDALAGGKLAGGTRWQGSRFPDRPAARNRNARTFFLAGIARRSPRCCWPGPTKDDTRLGHACRKTLREEQRTTFPTRCRVRR